MDGFFQYPYRWQQILQRDMPTQIAMLEERDRALENFFHLGGQCPLELPYRWEQILPGLAAGESWAIACLEENDRVIEGLFANCNCGSEGWTVTFRGAPFAGSAYAEYEMPEGAVLESVSTTGEFAAGEKAYISPAVYDPSTFDNFVGIWGENFFYSTAPGGHPDRTEIQMIYGSFSLTDSQWGPFPNLTDWESSLAWDGTPWPAKYGWNSGNFLGYNLPLSVSSGSTLSVEVSPDLFLSSWTADIVFTFSGPGSDTVIDF